MRDRIDSFVLYRSFYEALSILPDEVCGKVFKYISAYALNGDIVIDEIEDVYIKSMMILMRPQIDANLARYEKSKRAGAPRGNNNARKSHAQKVDTQAAELPLQSITEETEQVITKEEVGEHKEERIYNQINPNGTAEQTNSEADVIDTKSFTKSDGAVLFDNNVTKAAEPAKSKSKVFKAPTIEEVRDYCTLRGNNVDATKFVAFYAAKGWMIGKNKMKDWHSAVITWEGRDSLPRGDTTTKEIKYGDRVIHPNGWIEYNKSDPRYIPNPDEEDVLMERIQAARGW